jgi:phage shock protein PspC (stress-responsive transcriptional regulator)
MAGMSSIWTIRRSTSDVKLAGLCGGVARHWGIDPVLVRVGWALLALSGGIGVILYLAGWLLLPTDGRETAPAEDMFGDAVRKWPREVWVAIVVIACVAGFALFNGVTPFGIGPAVVVALVWYFGFYRKRMAKTGPMPPPGPAAVPAPPAAPFRYPGPPTAFTEAADAWQRRVAEHQATERATVPPVPPWSAPPPSNFAPPPSVPTYGPPPAPPSLMPDPEQVQRAAFLATPDPAGLYVEPTGSTVSERLVRPGRRPSARRLRWATLLALGLTMAGLGTADSAGAAIGPAVYVAAALLVLGIALILATWWGRAWGLLPVGALLAVAVLGFSAAGSAIPAVTAPPGTPESAIRYVSPADFPAKGDFRDFGTLTVDLADLKLTEDATYQAGMDVGRIVVTVPAQANVVVRYRADAGSVTAFGQHLSGTELNETISDPTPMQQTRPTLTLDLGVDLGSVEVRR